MEERTEQDVLVVKITSYGKHDAKHKQNIAGIAAKHLYHAFGKDRVEIWREGVELTDKDLKMNGKEHA